MTGCVNCGAPVRRPDRFRVKLQEYGAILPYVDGPLCVRCWDAALAALRGRQRTERRVEA